MHLPVGLGGRLFKVKIVPDVGRQAGAPDTSGFISAIPLSEIHGLV